MASLLKGYADYLLPITAPPTATTTNVRSLFDFDGKLSLLSVIIVPYQSGVSRSCMLQGDIRTHDIQPFDYSYSFHQHQ